MIICPEVFWLLLRKSQVSKLNIAIFCISISQSSAACVEKIINSHSQKSKWKERKRESRPFEKKRGFRLDKSSRKYVLTTITSSSSSPLDHHRSIHRSTTNKPGWLLKQKRNRVSLGHHHHSASMLCVVNLPISRWEKEKERKKL